MKETTKTWPARFSPGGNTLHYLLALWIALFSLTILGARGLPQEGLTFTMRAPEIVFLEHITFSTTLNSPSPVEEASLFIRPTNQETRLISLFPTPEGTLEARLDLADNFLRPFSTVDYWYRVVLEDGAIITSSTQTFFYEDTRYAWQRLEGGSLKVAWATGDLKFGQEVLNVAAAGLRAASVIIPSDVPPPIRIYVYPSADELQSTFTKTDTPWAAGHASPDLGVVLVSISPGPDQRAEMERQLPHEMMHILQYQVVGEAYNRLPVWLVEGMASAIELYPNQEYQRVLDYAVRSDGLLPMVDLCSAFPQDFSGALLAYAQSTSFVRFLHQNFGSSSLLSLMDAYQDGLGCAEGVRKVYSESIFQLENRWQQEALGRDINLLAWQNLWPYLLLSLALFVPIALTLLPFRRKPLPKESHNGS